MPLAYRDTVTSSGAFDRTVLMRLAIGKAHVERSYGMAWPAALSFGLNQVWQSARALRSSMCHQTAFAKLGALQQEIVRCETAALLAESAIRPRPAEAAAHRQRIAELRASAKAS